MTRRWLFEQGAFLAFSAGLLLLVFEKTALDVDFARLFFDARTNDFPLRQHAIFNPLFYYGFKFAMLAAGFVAVIVSLFGLSGRLPWLARNNALLALLGLILIPSAVALLKLKTNRHCPWDVLEFGGFAPYVGLLAEMPAAVVRGVCFPAAHAATGFMWLAWGLAMQDYSARWSRRMIGGALLLGLFMGLCRQAQGGHFLSHTLWSAWLAWAISVLLAGVLGLAGQPASEGDEHQAPDRSRKDQAE